MSLEPRQVMEEFKAHTSNQFFSLVTLAVSSPIQNMQDICLSTAAAFLWNCLVGGVDVAIRTVLPCRIKGILGSFEYK